MFEITVETVFAASHAIRLADGSVEPLHGHNWTVVVAVGANRLDSMQTVMDFHELERIVHAIIDPWHNRHLNDLPPFTTDSQASVNPSAERVAWWIGTRVAEQLPDPVRLLHVAVGEAPGCTAIYRGTQIADQVTGP